MTIERTQITYRLANKHDYKGLIKFYKRQNSRRCLRRILNEDSVRIAVAQIDDIIIGKALIYILPWTAGKKKDKRAIIAEVFVDKRYRGRGIATDLMKFCIKTVKNVAEDIQVDRVEPENKAAIRLYKNLLSKERVTFMS